MVRKGGSDREGILERRRTLVGPSVRKEPDV